MVSGSWEVWYLVSWNYFLSLWQGLFAFCSYRYTNFFSWVKLFGYVSQDCLQLITAVTESGLLLHIFMNWAWWCFFSFQNKAKDSFMKECISVSCSWLEEYSYYFIQKQNHCHTQCQQWSQRPYDLQLLDDDSSICLCLTVFPSWLYCHLVIWGNYTRGWNKQQAFKHWIGNVLQSTWIELLIKCKTFNGIFLLV